MRIPARLPAALLLTVSLLSGCSHSTGIGVAAAPVHRPPENLTAPDSFSVSMETTRGTVLMTLYRQWAPLGVDRFYTLVVEHYYDGAPIFRVEPGFVVQFGLAADPAVTAVYRRLALADDTVRQSNLRGTVTFARGGPNSRTTQLFINLVDNTRLDVANGFGFPPIGRVTSGFDLVQKFNAEYQPKPPRQDSIVSEGSRYIDRHYPRLDRIVRLTLVPPAPH